MTGTVTANGTGDTLNVKADKDNYTDVWVSDRHREPGSLRSNAATVNDTAGRHCSTQTTSNFLITPKLFYSDIYTFTNQSRVLT